MRDNLNNLWQHLSKKRRRQSKITLLLMIVASLAEMVSIGSVIPFLGVLTSPDALYKHDLMQPLVSLLDIPSSDHLIFPITIIFILLSIMSGGVRILLLYLMTRLSYAIGGDLSIDMYRKTLYQDYSVHMSRNSSQLISGITNKTNIVINEIITPVFVILSSVVIMAGILLILLIIDPEVALFSFAGFGGGYWLIVRYTKSSLLKNSKIISKESTRTVKFLQEGIGGIRDILIDGMQTTYCNLYRTADLPLRKATGVNRFISMSPKFVVESLGMVLIAVLAYVISQGESGVSGAIPVLGALALGAQRLLPILQQTYSALSVIRGSHSSFIDVLDLLDQNIDKSLTVKSVDRLQFNKSIEFRDVDFKYDDNQKMILNKANITIQKGSSVGLVGESGSGKSTMLDIFMSLLFPVGGGVFIDGIRVTKKNYRSWQGQIAHIPQNIFLSDGTIAENIAFGVPSEKIDYDRVAFVSEKALLKDLVDSWDKGLHTHIGERGIRISGGQRQRIAIARALYKESFKVLVLDEATSALDSDTEKKIMDNIYEIGKDLTVIIIAHRITTLKGCDTIYKITSTGEVIDIPLSSLSS